MEKDTERKEAKLENSVAFALVDKTERKNEEAKQPELDLNAKPPGCTISNSSSLIKLGANGLAEIISAYSLRKPDNFTDLDAIKKFESTFYRITSVAVESIASGVQADLANGIHKEDVPKRRDWYGSNAREKAKLRTIWEILCNVLEDTMLRILLVASILVIVINEITDDTERATGTL